nr:type I polyketide synthase [Listeria sp. PSOL-1]
MNLHFWIVTPFERPDVKLATEVKKAGGFPILHLGRDKEIAREALKELAMKVEQFGVCLSDLSMSDITLPENVTTIVQPWGFPERKKQEVVWQIHSMEEAQEAIHKKKNKLIIKGAEGSGLSGKETTFLLFQQMNELCKEVEVFVQGGVGIHSAAAYGALGAAGIIMDSQIALFPECSVSSDVKKHLGHLSGNEIQDENNYKFYILPNKEKLALGQDILLAGDLVSEYRHLKYLIKAVSRTVFTHVKQAKQRDPFGEDSALSKEFGIRYPIAQGPMARVSDVPEFLNDVALGGGLPFFAMSMLSGKVAEDALEKTTEMLGEKSWGVGLLGFIYPSKFEEQTQLVLKAKPSHVLIAGGRPAQAKVFEKEGIKVLLHTPAPSLLEMFLKEGARTFIFEGRESGGHVGPIYSTILWEKQINKILKVSTPSEITAFFAGGIHDDLTAAFVQIMTAPLSVRDVKVGLLCGTAYLYSNEIVERKAITSTYQKMLIEKKQTLILKSGKGQDTRCVPSTFTDFFNAEKARMIAEKLDSGELLLKLEELNLGRLRIAAKGIERKENELIQLTTKEQLESGLFMTGAITSFSEKIRSIKEIHQMISQGSKELTAKIAIPEKTTQESKSVDVAIVGMAGIFPGAEDKEEYWSNIVFGRDCITEIPDERWSKEMFYDPETKDTDHVVSKWGGFLGKNDFDALEFGITPQSLAAIEPVQLLSLVVTKRALEDAGYTNLDEDNFEETSVIFGAQGAGELATSYGSRAGLQQLLGELPEEAKEILPRLTEDSFPGVLSNVIAGRISNRLNTGGRNFTVDAACASSLAALDIALSELTTEKANMVILGGADLHNSIYDFLMFSSTFALSKKGRCATFDESADGIALGEGVGVVVLKRLEDAKRDGNKILAVIKGIGGSSDGKSLGLTAPSRRGQVKALEQAYEKAGVNPLDVGLIEAHGTGTAVGDQIELNALTDVFLDNGSKPGSIKLGSVKSQIGHTKCAAGVAGLMKAVNSVRYGIFPPTLHLRQPNAAYFPHSPFSFRTEKPSFWNEERRIAGISGFGFGGTNFHTIIQNYDTEIIDTPIEHWPSELFVFAGETPEEAVELMEKVQALYTMNDKLKLRDIAYSISKYSQEKTIQYVIVAKTREELLLRINMAKEGKTDESIQKRTKIDGKIAFMFSGQGSQRINMAADLFMVFPQLRRLLKGNERYEKILFSDQAFTPEEKRTQQEKIKDTKNAQPLLGIVDTAIAQLLTSFGIQPDMVAGHSYGELPALSFAGVFDTDHLLQLSEKRATAILSSVSEDAGKMAAVRTDKETMENIIAGLKEVWAVNYNSPQQTVIAASQEGMKSFIKKAEELNLSYTEINVSCAFHSPLLAKAQDYFAEALSNVRFKKANLPVWSNTTSKVYPKDTSAIRKRLAEHVVKPVRFVEEVEAMYEDGARIFIEVGPGGTLTSLVNQTLAKEEFVSLQVERANEDGVTYFLQTLAKYIATGRTINMENMYKGRKVTLIDLEKPEKYKKNATVWNVDGKAATPEKGELPAHAGKQVNGELLSLHSLRKNHSETGSPENIVMAYLDNMNAMIQDQRDVMLGYLGSPEIAPRTATERRQFAYNNTPEVLDTNENLIEHTETAPVEEANGLPEIASLSSEEIATIILEIVSEKTGYPMEMLDLDMDLEADLSIDSIKKMEIVGALGERVSLPENEDGMDAFFEKMISIKKFRDLVSWIEEIGKAVSEGTVSSSSSAEFEGAAALDHLTSTEKETDMLSNEVVRMILEKVSSPILEIESAHIKDKTLAIATGNKALGAKVIETLNQHGAKADLVEKVDLAKSNGLIMLHSIENKEQTSAKQIFNLLKQADMNNLEWVITLDDTLSKESKEVPEGFTGFIKALVHEHPDVSFCSITLMNALNNEQLSQIILQELCTEDTYPEIVYEANERFKVVPKITSKEEEATETLVTLKQESVVLVLGGAQGITPHLVAKLALKYPCHYVLVGRTEFNGINEAQKDLETIEEIRQHLITVEGMKQPKEIELKTKEIFKTKQIASAMALIEKNGGKATYKKADVTNQEELRDLIANVKEESGKIEGLIHAAGILEDKLFKNKELTSFERVYDTKVLPLQVIMDELATELKLLVLFSSMSSAFGNAGQCDYSSGNSAMDMAITNFQAANPSLVIKSFNWGPWKGAGMVDAGLENEFRKKGISFIELDKGGDFFVNEILYGKNARVLAIAGEEENMAHFIETILIKEKIHV